MRTMTTDEARAFLLTGTRTGKLATVRQDGRPHVAPIWFVLDGDDVIFNTGADTLKGKALRRDPRVAMVVDDESPPFAYVLVEGDVHDHRGPRRDARVGDPDRRPVHGRGPRRSSGAATPSPANCSSASRPTKLLARAEIMTA